MEHILKKCPICGSEFFVLKKAEEKAVYCTLECLEMAQKTFRENSENRDALLASLE